MLLETSELASCDSDGLLVADIANSLDRHGEFPGHLKTLATSDCAILGACEDGLMDLFHVHDVPLKSDVHMNAPSRESHERGLRP